MLKDNKEILKEKIEYTQERIDRRIQKIDELRELSDCNRRILNDLRFRREHEKIILDIKTNSTKTIKSEPVEISDYEKNLEKENSEIVKQIVKIEKEVKTLCETKKNLSSILHGTKEKSTRSK